MLGHCFKPNFLNQKKSEENVLNGYLRHEAADPKNLGGFF